MTVADILLWVGMGGCGGEAMMGVRRGWGRGVGRGFNQSFIGMHITGRNQPKIAILRGFSCFWQGILVL